ncbi:hypothetical protein [Actinoplanes sp. L3-i22]|uniref:hypothetical protein n=1 Tax=Actinoplanes sp. L3-i22 TaxID=2836373 RepID=UPI001C856B92|nr:hypothetical protein [Actinoplanes sp. L3-i22]
MATVAVPVATPALGGAAASGSDRAAQATPAASGAVTAMASTVPAARLTSCRR